MISLVGNGAYFQPKCVTCPLHPETLPFILLFTIKTQKYKSNPAEFYKGKEFK